MTGDGKTAADNPRQPAHGWRAVAAEATGAGEHAGLWSTTWMLISAPVRNAVAIAEDPQSRSHFKFFSMCLAAWLAFLLIAVPRFTAWYTGDELPTIDTKYASAQLTILEYVDVTVLVLAGFFIYRLGATRQQTPMSYYKFALLGAGLLMLLSVALQSLRIAGIVAIQNMFNDATSEAIVENPALITAVNIGFVIVMVIGLVALNRAFWGLRWRFVVPATLALMALNLAAVLGVLYALEQPPIKDAIKGLL